MGDVMALGDIDYLSDIGRLRFNRTVGESRIDTWLNAETLIKIRW